MAYQNKKEYRVRNWLAKKYTTEGCSANDIAKLCGTTQSTIFKWLKKFNINTRAVGEALRLKHAINPSYNRGENNPAWAGGRTRGTHDYFLVYQPNHPNKNSNNNVLEHRLVMEKKLGRYLTKDELVHHINGIRDDNRIENLELTAKNEHKLRYRSGYQEGFGMGNNQILYKMIGLEELIGRTV